jgi:hypothetical protein
MSDNIMQFPSIATAPSAPPAEYDPLQQELINFATKYQVAPQYISKLRKLIGWDIVIICDDSGSMSSTSDAFPSTDPFARKFSRFDELKMIVDQILGIANVLDDDGTDLYFLNRGVARNIKSHEQVAQLFTAPPSGSTPLVTTFNQAIADKVATLGEKNLLVIIITDGLPDNGITEFIAAVANKPNNVHVSIAACTDDAEVMKNFNEMDGKIDFVDVVDDYQNELKQILAVQGKNFPFSHGDWVCKILLGSIDPYFDAMDEQPVDIETGEGKKRSSLMTRTPVGVASTGGCWWCGW